MKAENHFSTNNLKGFAIENLEHGIIAAGAVLFYLEETEHNEVKHIASVSRIAEEKFVWLDKFTIRNLELVYPQQEGGIPLIHILDHTVTPMGSRMMRKWLVLPLKEKEPIEDRLKIVDYFFEVEELREEILVYLKQIGDLERLISKVAVGRINPREMNQLKKALRNTIPIKSLLSASKSESLKKLGDLINSCEFLLEKIDRELQEDAPMLIHQGGIINSGVDADLDEYRGLANTGKDFLISMQQREVQRTALPRVHSIRSLAMLEVPIRI